VITVINLRKGDHEGITWQRLNVELMFSKDQARMVSSTAMKSGAENYYNNYIYSDGWDYKGLNLGNPLFTTREFARSTLVEKNGENFLNNRIHAITVGFLKSVGDISLTGKVTFSKNYGTCRTSGAPYRGVGGTTLNPSPELQFHTQNQWSSYLKADKPISKTLHGGIVFSTDRGTLLNNASAVMVNMVKTIK
jgi:hypothetical protein